MLAESSVAAPVVDSVPVMAVLLAFRAASVVMPETPRVLDSVAAPVTPSVPPTATFWSKSAE